jgi:E3 ubiquitin-protein ligase HUWE1
VEDLKENVEYSNYNAESKTIIWLWELLQSYDKSKRAAFLQFVTGCSKVPLSGFKDLRGMSGPQKL